MDSEVIWRRSERSLLRNGYNNDYAMGKTHSLACMKFDAYAKQKASLLPSGVPNIQCIFIYSSVSATSTLLAIGPILQIILYDLSATALFSLTNLC